MIQIQTLTTMTFSNPTKRNWLIGFLIAFNIVLLAVLFFGHRPQRHRPDMEASFKHELQLSDEQATQFRDLRKSYFEQSRPLHEALGEGRKKMIESLGAAPVDMIAFQRISNENGQIQAQLDSLLARHFLALKAVCRPDQQEKFKDVFLRATQKQKRMGKNR